MKQKNNRIFLKLKNNHGLTMVEMLCAVLILLLVSQGMAAGVALANRQYEKSIQTSEAQELYGTLRTILSNELRYTTDVTLQPGSNQVGSFFSRTYAIKNAETSLVALDENGEECSYGELALGNNGSYNRLLGSASYPHRLTAKASVQYQETDQIFTVNLIIAIENEPCIEESFQIRAMNDVKVH